MDSQGLPIIKVVFLGSFLRKSFPNPPQNWARILAAPETRYNAVAQQNPET